MEAETRGTYFIIPSFVLTTVSAIVLLLYWRRKNGSAPSNLPPGPFSLPIVGTIPFLGKDIREAFKQLSVQYGDVFTVYLGTRPSIILTSYESIREAFVKYGNVFSERPQDMDLIKQTIGPNGIISGSEWQAQRKFVHVVLRDLGVGTSILEHRILTEIEFMVKELDKAASKTCGHDPHVILNKAVSNVICSMTYGKRSDYQDPNFTRCCEVLNENFKLLGDGQSVKVFPWLQYLPGDMFKVKSYLRNVTFLKDDVRARIDALRQDVPEPEEKATNLVHAYLQKIQNATPEEAQAFNDAQMEIAILDMFAAGTETAATTLRWAIVYLVHHPDIQQAIQREIDSVVARDQPPRWSERVQLPYTEACLYEVQRLADIAPISIPHCASEDTVFRGYNIPRGTTLYATLYCVHRDEKSWEKPYDFYPQHFLTDDGSLQRKEHLVPFSIGKRICLGEGMAKMELFLFFTALLQRYTFSKAEGEPMPSKDGILGVTHMPKPFKVAIEKRPC